MSDNYNILVQKLNKFIRKYYLNQMLRGLIWFIAVSALFFLIINVFEYYSWSSSSIRTILFFMYLGLNTIILAGLVIIPLLKRFRVGRIIDEEEAAKIIGKHFPEVKDKLLNTIQLKKLSQENGTLELLQASIEQKTKTLHPVPFVRAVDLRKNRKYLRYALPPLLLILILLFSAPATITEPSKRLLNYSSDFERPLPFRIIVLNENLSAVQQENFTIRVRAEGDVMPAGMLLSVNNSMLPFEKISGNEFHYTLNNLHNDIQFSIQAESYSFGPYYLRVLPKPIIINYELALDYPEYTGKQDEVFENTGDVIVPEGSRLSWNFITRDAEKLTFRIGNNAVELDSEGSNAFKYSMRVKQNLAYSVSVANRHLANPDSLAYSITSIPDMYPTVIVEEFRDSVYEKMLYFRGQISDDYGFTQLKFNYEFLNHFDSARIEGKVYSEDVAFSAGIPKQMVFHHFNLDRLEIGPGDEIAYFFEVWDNDEVNGYKSSKSHKMIFRAPTIEEISEQTRADNNEIKDEMENIIDESRMLQKQIEKLNKQLINKESLNWQDKEQIKSLIRQQEQLHQRMELLQEKNMQKMSREEEYNQLNEDILQKHQQLQELFNELMDDEMKKMFGELQKLLDELRKDDVSKMLEKMKMSAEEIEQELDKNLELFKQLEFEKKLTETIEKLNKLAKEQEKLANKTKEKKAGEESLSEEQQELNQAFDDLRKDLDELDALNEELENKHSLEDTESQENSIQEDMEKSLEELKKGNNKKASGSQQDAQKKMKEMAEKLFQMQMQMAQESNAEDIRTLREILENLLVISFDQEDLIADLGKTSPVDPRYQEIIERQHELRDNMKIVEDSLYALSKRQIMIQPFVNKEVDKINKNIDDANDRLDERKKGDAASSQQYVMTSVNNLALLLAEALNKMQQMNNMDMPGSSSCDNPGGSTPSKMPQNMSEMQQMLNQQMKQMKDGQQGKDGKRSMSEQFARMAAEQEMIRRQMQEYLEQLKSQGETGDAGMNKLMEEMEKTEMDLVNKRLTEETLQRQEEILTRLLKHEKAMREREKEERRESTEAKNQDYSNPGDFLEYKRILLKEVELLKTVPPNLKPYYKRKVNEYFYNFGN
ncbi:MAG: DUF4175 family protein [Bacteroidales bacterium]|nr:DUF4175 family protein [Bacteroidales bacterium]